MRISDWSSDVCSSDLALHADLAPLFRQLAVAPEQKGRPLDPHIGAAVILLFYPRTERFAHRAILVRGETDGQAIFVAKLAELRRRIARHRQHLRVQMREFGREAGEILRRSEEHTSELQSLM